MVSESRNSQHRSLLNEIRHNLSKVDQTHICTVSFCESGDLLSQWRGYAAQGKGYAMGFDLKELSIIAKHIDNLVAARGLTDCQQAYKLAKRLQQECAEFAQLSQNTVYWNLSHRACVIAWLKACVLYVANGGKWEKSIEEFIRWSLNYDLWCKMADRKSVV